MEGKKTKMKVTFDLEPYVLQKLCEMMQSDKLHLYRRLTENEIVNDAIMTHYRYVNGILKDPKEK